MSRFPLALPLLLLVACGPSGDPADETFAAELGVDLSAMEKRESGLYVQDLVVGTGAEAQAGMWVSADYTGWLTDGTQFDSSKLEGREPIRFTLGLGRVIAGWEEGLQGMRVGGKRKLVLPSALAYGSEGRGSIPGNAVLVFDVELVGANVLQGGDPTKVTFAPELGVDLAAMQRRDIGAYGLWVQDLVEGTGAEAAAGMRLKVNYTGWLADGTQFDSSKLEGREPLLFTLGVTPLITGFAEGVVGMRVGGTRKLVIPSALAYGASAHGAIPPDSVLVFDVELLEATAQ